MNRNRSLVAGLSLLLALAGCSEDTKVVNAVGSYAPVITGLAIDREPAVRGQDNELTVRVTNVNAVPLTYHWKAYAGVLLDSTTQSVTWTAPDTIGTYTIYVSIAGTDENGQSYFRERNFSVYVDNAFIRWTSGEQVRFDPAPPLGQAPGPGNPLLFAEMENPSTGESRIMALDAPMGTPTPLTDAFFAASGPTLRADGNQIAFAGKARQADPGNSIYAVAATGAGPDTTTALPIMRYRSNSNSVQGNPRFARTGTLLAYNSDSTSLGNPKIYVRDAANLNVAPMRLLMGFTDIFNSFWIPAWNPAGDSVVVASYSSFNQATQKHRGVYKLLALSPFQSSATQWLPDSGATECDWSADGAFVAFAKRNTAGDRDIWIIRSDTNNPALAVRVTRGPSDDSHPRFSHDGNTIYFISNRVDRYGLGGVFETQRRGYNIWSVSEFDLPQ